MREFVPLDVHLRAVPAPQPAPCAQPASGDAACADPIYDDVSGELALIKLAAMEAYERAIERALAAFAELVLGRELTCAPAAIAALAAQAWEEYTFEEPIALVVAQQDAMLVRSPLPVRIDPALAPGDFFVEVRDGTIDARLCVRKRAALRAALAGEV